METMALDRDDPEVVARAAEIDQMLATAGWAIVSMRLQGTQESWLHYTVGLTDQGKPELAVETATKDVGRKVLKTLVATCDQRHGLAQGEEVVLGGIVWRAHMMTNPKVAYFAARKYAFVRVALMLRKA